MSVQVIAEVGINHNGDLGTATALACKAVEFAGADYVKFQKRTPELCVPRDQWDVRRDTPWGEMSYIEYRRRMEFDESDFRALDEALRHRGVPWFLSVWDVQALRFALQFEPPYIKIPSALATQWDLVKAALETEVPLIVSVGMTSQAQVMHLSAVCWEHYRDRTPYMVTVLHCHSAYPAPTHELNLRAIDTLRQITQLPVGYSGHEHGVDPTIAAVHYGATMVERHITFDRGAWGSDHKSSLEPDVFYRMVKHIRSAERQIGHGRKVVWESEEPAMRKLRGT